MSWQRKTRLPISQLFDERNKPIILKIHEKFHRILLATLMGLVAACASNAPTPETHHDAFVEHWVGKTKTHAIAELGQPTQQTSLSTGEATLLWDHPQDHCSIALHTNKDGKIESGHNSCDTKRSDGQSATDGKK